MFCLVELDFAFGGFYGFFFAYVPKRNVIIDKPDPKITVHYSFSIVAPVCVASGTST